MDLGILSALAGSAAALAFGAWYRSGAQVKLRELAAYRPVLVRDAPAGERVRITGILRARERTLVAPMSGRPCAHYELLVEELVSNGDSRSWNRLTQRVESTDFEIEDESGRAIVETRSFEAKVLVDRRDDGSTGEPARARVERELERGLQRPQGFFGNDQTYRYAEGVLEPGARVTVLGRARWEDDPDPSSGGAPQTGGYRASARPQRLVIERDADRVRASDDRGPLAR